MNARVTDLGEIHAPILVCGGAYSNLEALQAVLAEAARLHVPASRIIHTGDVIAYGADPQACVDLLAGSGAQAIMGNVEEQLSAGALDCACGYDKGTVCGTLAADWYGYANSNVDKAARRWMAGLPGQLIFGLGGVRIRVVHGGVKTINRFIYRTSEDNTFEEELHDAGTDAVVAGHSGIPFTRIQGNRLWHNSGAIGLPANDGTPRGWYSLISPLPEGGVRIAHRPLYYDHAAASAKMRARGLPVPYAEALVTGFLPEGNALPPAEQARAGMALALDDLAWRPAAVQVAE